MIAEFTTLVGLLATFKQLRDGCEAKDEAAFKQWLISHKFDALSEQIAQSHHLNAELSELMRMDAADLMAKLETIEGIVLSVSQKIDGLQGLANRYSAESQLSDQAVATLKAMDDSTAGTGILFERRQEYFLMLLPQGQGTIQPSENRYFRDDVEHLVGLGWLAVIDHTSDGHPKLQVTRAGSRAAKQLTEQG